MRSTADGLRRETQSLSTALRKPQVRGRWGEMHLRRTVELAGLVDRCDFAEQVRLDDGARRPDLVVNLVGNRRIVVDAKVPLDAYLDATSTDDEAEHRRHLRRHAAQLRAHIDGLASKQYWRSLEESPEFVVLFVPAESFLAAALETDGTLIEYAATRQVVLATPTTLIALLRTVAHGWRHEVLADQAREIHRLGRELHARLSGLNGHLDQLGRSLNAAVGHFNQTVGSLESRVLVTARRFGELGVTDDELGSPRQVESATRVRTTLRAARGRTARRRRRGWMRTITWLCEPESDPLGRGARAGPTGRRARSRARAVRGGPRPAALRERRAALRHLLRAASAWPSLSPCGPRTSSPSGCSRRC